MIVNLTVSYASAKIPVRFGIKHLHSLGVRSIFKARSSDVYLILTHNSFDKESINV